jgi:hypothetical protein
VCGRSNQPKETTGCQTKMTISVFMNSLYFLNILRLVVISRFNYLPHAISINRKISKNQNAMHSSVFLPWLLKTALV